MPTECIFCKKIVKCKSQLFIHLTGHIHERPYNCSVCDKSFSEPRVLNAHNRKDHLGFKPNECIFCGKKYFKYNDLQLHLTGHVGEKPYHCDLCDRSFIVKCNLVSHKTSHSIDIENRHPCSLCQKAFPTLQRLRLHLRTHTGERPYKCVTCSRTFAQSSALTMHQRAHHSAQKTFSCDNCDQTFFTKASLDWHSQKHHSVAVRRKTHDCLICGKAYNSKEGRRVHMLTFHSGIKAFKCDLCQKTFAMKGYLNAHLMSHTGEKPYKCVQCGKCFASFVSLSLHKNASHPFQPL